MLPSTISTSSSSRTNTPVSGLSWVLMMTHSLAHCQNWAWVVQNCLESRQITRAVCFRFLFFSFFSFFSLNLFILSAESVWIGSDFHYHCFRVFSRLGVSALVSNPKRGCLVALHSYAVLKERRLRYTTRFQSEAQPVWSALQTKSPTVFCEHPNRRPLWWEPAQPVPAA